MATAAAAATAAACRRHMLSCAPATRRPGRVFNGRRRLVPAFPLIDNSFTPALLYFARGSCYSSRVPIGGSSCTVLRFDCKLREHAVVSHQQQLRMKSFSSEVLVRGRPAKQRQQMGRTIKRTVAYVISACDRTTAADDQVEWSCSWDIRWHGSNTTHPHLLWRRQSLETGVKCVLCLEASGTE